MNVAMSQLKDAFGFIIKVPQAGQPGYDFNYQVMQWYAQNWNDTLETSSGQQYSVRNPYAVSVSYSRLQ